MRLGAHLLTPNGKQDAVDFLLPPIEAGDYRLDVDLVQEDVAWFGNACTIRLVVR